MKKINVKKTVAHSILWILTLLLAGYLIDIAYVKPMIKWADSFKNGVLLFVLLTIFYIGLIKVIHWATKAFYWVIDNI